jgi:hypothetical protein
MKAQLRHIFLIVQATSLLRCGSPGDRPKETCALCGTLNDIRGSIGTKSGSQAQMVGWVIAAFERDTGIARVSEIDNAGLFSWGSVRTDQAQTVAMMTPDYILQAVASVPSGGDKAVQQFFFIQKPIIPKLINSGPIVTFQNFDGIKLSKELAADQNGDQIPDGAAHIQGISLTQGPSANDTDLDGVPNFRDPDIDGDGVINGIDPDDDGDGIRDAFDADQNSDLLNDAARGGDNFDLYFKEGVEWIAVQYESKPKDDSTTIETTLKFTTKVRSDVTPNSVQIRGAPSLLNAATYFAPDAAGQMSVQPWNRLLQDDGVSEDSGAGDRLFAKKVNLSAGKSPRSYETIFFQLVFGPQDKPYYLEYPYIFPDVKTSAISAQYDANTRTVLLVGNPFGDVQDFVWTITVWDSKGKSVWTSQAVVGTTRQFQVQENIIAPGETYKYSVVAQTLDKIPGYPSYTIHSVKYDLK